MQNKPSSKFTVTSLIFIIVGIILLAMPSVALTTASIILGIVIAIYGIMRIIEYAKNGGATIDLIWGILLALVGAVLMVSPSFIASLIPIVIGIYFIIEGVADLTRALDLKRNGYGKWFVPVIFAVAFLIFGIVMVANPFGTSSLIVRILGVAAILEGVSTIFSNVKT